jgi:hypothetical protein
MDHEIEQHVASMYEICRGDDRRLASLAALAFDLGLRDQARGYVEAAYSAFDDRSEDGSYLVTLAALAADLGLADLAEEFLGTAYDAFDRRSSNHQAPRQGNR